MKIKSVAIARKTSLVGIVVMVSEQFQKVYDLLAYIACLSEHDEFVPVTADRLREINKATHELAHEMGKIVW